MTIGRVTDALAFVLANGEFTQTILFAEDEIEQLKPDERAAASAVLKHVEICYVELLSECRQAFLDAAKDSPLEPNRKTLERSKNSPRTIWKRETAQVLLIIRSSWVAWVSFGLWPATDASSAIKLVALIEAQRRFSSELHDAVRATGVDVRPRRGGHLVEGKRPEEGMPFRKLAEDLAERTLPIAIELYQRIAAKPITPKQPAA